jgi:hypothetical protein
VGNILWQRQWIKERAMRISLRIKSVCVLLASMLATTSGCGSGTPPGAGPGTPPSAANKITRKYDKPVPDLPPAGKIHIVAEKIKHAAETLHYKWTIVGDRNWTGTSTTMDAVELNGAYALDSDVIGGGTNAYEYELILSADRSTDGKHGIKYEFSFKTIGVQLPGAVTSKVGSGGGGSGSGGIWNDIKPLSLDQAAKVVLVGDQTLDIPLDQIVVELHGESADGQPLKVEFKIRAAE